MAMAVPAAAVRAAAVPDEDGAHQRDIGKPRRIRPDSSPVNCRTPPVQKARIGQKPGARAKRAPRAAPRLASQPAP